MDYLSCRIYTTSHFYDSIYGMNICIRTHKYSPKVSLVLVSCPNPTLPERKGLVTIRHPTRAIDIAVWHVK